MRLERGHWLNQQSYVPSFILHSSILAVDYMTNYEFLRWEDMAD